MRRILALAAAFLAIVIFFGCQSPHRASPAHVISLRPGQSIQAAIDAAEESAVLVLSAGTFQENLRIDKSLTIRGAGPQSTIIQAIRPGPPVIWIVGEAQVVVENLAVQAGRGGHVSVELSSAGLFVQDRACLTLRRAEISQNAASGIFAKDGAILILEDVNITENIRYGIELFGQAQARALSARIFANKSGGVWLAEGAFMEAEESAVFGNAGPGIWVRGQAKARLWRVEIRENRGPGVRGQDEAEVRALAARIAQNEEAGVTISDRAHFSAYGTFFEANWDGLELWGGSAFLQGCTVVGNRWDGIIGRGKATVTVQECQILAGQGAGVSALGQAEITLRHNEIRDFLGPGVSGFSKAAISGEGNDFFNTGVPLLGHVDPGLRRPKAQPSYQLLRFPNPEFADLQEAMDALLPGGVLELSAGQHSAGVTVDKILEIRGNGEAIIFGSSGAPVFSLVRGAWLQLSGVHVTGGAEGLALAAGSKAELHECSIWENAVGLKLWQDAQLFAARVSIAYHSQGGIWVWDESSATLEEVTVFRNDVCGIGVGGQSSLVLGQSTVMENGWQGGVLLRDLAQVELWNNVFAENRGHGVAAASPACVGSGPGFFGKVVGGGNRFSGNYKGPVCPAELSFLGH